MIAEEEIGRVTHFFSRVMAAGIKLVAPLKVGDKIHIKGRTTDIQLTVESMEIHNVKVTEAKAGDEVGIKVPTRVREGDRVYRISPTS